MLLQAPISDYNLADVLDSEESTPSKRITTCRTDVRNWRAALQSYSAARSDIPGLTADSRP